MSKNLLYVLSIWATYFEANAQGRKLANMLFGFIHVLHERFSDSAVIEKMF